MLFRFRLAFRMMAAGGSSIKSRHSPHQPPHLLSSDVAASRHTHTNTLCSLVCVCVCVQAHPGIMRREQVVVAAGDPHEKARANSRTDRDSVWREEKRANHHHSTLSLVGIVMMWAVHEVEWEKQQRTAASRLKTNPSSIIHPLDRSLHIADVCVGVYVCEH